MKILFTISAFLILFVAFTVKAQLVTITETHQLPVIGDSIHYVDANTFGFDPVGVGLVTSKIWDESALLNAGTIKDFYYIDPTTIPIALGRDSFPTASIARGESGAIGYFYYQNTANDINRLGWYLDTTNFGIYKNGTIAREFHFPITAGQNFTSIYNGDYAPFNLGEDSSKITSGSTSINADMQGQLILPNGSYNNVLRLHVLENFHVQALYLGTPIIDYLISDDYYYWLVDTISQPILIYGTTSSNGTIQSTVLRYQSIVSTGIPSTENGNLKIYPNPSNGKFTIDNNNLLFKDYKLEICNLLGKKIQYFIMKDQKSTEMDISGYPKGVYFVTIHSDANMRTERIVIQ